VIGAPALASGGCPSDITNVSAVRRTTAQVMLRERRPSPEAEFPLRLTNNFPVSPSLAEAVQMHRPVGSSALSRHIRRVPSLPYSGRPHSTAEPLGRKNHRPGPPD
jgi:hypothetical protein